MKILTVFGPGKIAGAEKVVATGLNELVNDQMIHSFVALIREHNKPEFADEFADLLLKKNHISFLYSASPLDFKLISQLKNTIRSINPDIVHTHGYKALLYVFLVKFLTFTSRRTIHTHHGNTGHTVKVKFYEAVALFLMKFCTQVVSVSPKMTLELKSKKIKNIREIINMNSLAKSSGNAFPLFNKGIKNLLYLGRLSSEKNPKTLLTAFEAALKIEPHMFLHMVGDGPLLSSLENEFGDNPKIKFYGHQKEIRNFIEQSDYLCLPSLTEGMPMTVIEALCLGTPVIANDVGALPWMCTDKNSFLINLETFLDSNGSCDFNSLNMKWIEILVQAMSADKKTFALNNKEVEIDKYSVESWAIKTKQLYQESL